MIEILTAVSISCISILFVVAEPIILFKRWIGFKEENYGEYNKITQFVYRLINCCMCSGFLIGLLLAPQLGLQWYWIPIIPIMAELINKQLQ